MTNRFLSEVELRSRAEKRIKDRTGYYGHVLIFIAVNVMLWLIYSFSNSDFPFPIFTTFGWGAGLLAHSAEQFFNSGKRLEERERAVRAAMIETFGNDRHNNVTFEEYKTTRETVEKRFKQRSDFFAHIGVYLSINFMLWTLWGFSDDNGFPWPLFPTLIWGFFVAWNGLETFAKASWFSRESQLEREIERERELLLGEAQKAKRDPRKRHLVQTADDEMLEVVDVDSESADAAPFNDERRRTHNSQS